MHCSSDTNSVTPTTHCGWHQFFLASSPSRPHLPVPLYSSRGKAIEPSRAADRTGSERELIGPDLECVPDPVGGGSRVAGGGMVMSPFCSHL